MRACVCVRACVRACVRVCMYVFIYVMMTCASQIHDASVNDTIPDGILVTEHFDKQITKHSEYVNIVSLFCPASFSRSLICADINSQ